ncbi:unnamed protein product [Ectocarpus sp. 13 AM-2016]
MPRASRIPVQVEGVGLAHRQQQGESASAAVDDVAAQQRLRRLRRKRLAEKVVAHWKDFAREGIAEARARAHASAAPRRRGLTRWRAGATALRSARHRRTADVGRRRFLAESRGFAAWLAATRAARDRRRREEAGAAAVAAVAAERVLTKMARSSLHRWATWASVRRARRNAGNEAYVHTSSLLPGKLRRAIRRWQQHSANRQQFRRILIDVATVPRPPPAIPRRGAPPPLPARTPIPTPPPPASTTAEAFATAGRAQAASFLRRWRRAATRRRRARASAGLARRFRDHVLLLRHHEHWKAFVAGKKAAAELEAAAARLGRRARARRALLGLSKAAEASAEERDRVRPVLREAFSAWDKACADGMRKREHWEEEARERYRQATNRRVLRAWLCRARNSVDARGQVVEGERHRRGQCLRRAVRGWARAGLESRRRRRQLTASRKHADRRRLVSGLRVWRVAVAGMASRRAAKRVAMDKAASSLASRTLRAWRKRADLQAARKAVFRARITSATTIVAAGRLRRSFARWQEFHGSSQVATVTRLRAEGYARRKVLGKFWAAWVAVRELQKRRTAFRAKVVARRQLSLQREAFFSLVSVAEAGRREREKVGAALLLWKLHTQGKAFAALAAHRLRRRWKQDRARRAVGWRRERLIKDGALRWAATADTLSASRISSAAFREGNRAARRWEAAGRCARHWRRVAAARGMERRARDKLPRTSVAPMLGFPRDVRGDVARGYVGVRGGEGIVESWGVRFPRGGGGSPARRRGVATATGKTSGSGSRAGGSGKENVDEDGSSRGTAAAAADPARGAFPFSTNQRNGAVAQAAGTVNSITAEKQPGPAYRGGNGVSPATQTFSAVAAPWRSARAGPSYGRWASASAPARQHSGRTSCLRMVAGVGVDEENVCLSSRGPVEEGKVAAPGAEFTAGSRAPAPEEEGRVSPLSVRRSCGQGEEEEEENEHRSSSPPMTVGNLTQAACPLPAAASEPQWGRIQPGSGVDAGVYGGGPGGGGDLGGGGDAGRRRPAPRRPLELLLDETSGFAATASENRGQRGGGVATPLSTWVVDEMNRLFGAGGSVNNGLAVAGGGSSAVIDGDRGRRERAAMFRSAGHVDCGQPRQVACLPGRDGSRRSKDSGGQLLAPRKSTFSRAGRGEMAVASGRRLVPFRSAASPSVEQQRERRAGSRGNQQEEGLLQHPTEVPPLPATARPPQPALSQEDTISTPGGGARRVYGAPTAASCTCRSSSSSPPSCVRPATPRFDCEIMPLPVDVGSPLPAASALPAGAAGVGGAFEGDSCPSASEGAARAAMAAAAARTGRPGVRNGREVENTRIVVDDSNAAAAAAAAAISAPKATHSSPSSRESIADSTAGNSSVAQQQSPTAAFGFDGAATPYETEEADLEARVAKAERRLRALQGRARQRRRDKRELAALHQALAEQEGRTTHGGVGGSGSDGGEMGGGVDCPVDGKPSTALRSSAADNRGNNNAVGQGDLPLKISDNSSLSAVDPGNEEGQTPASIGASHSLDVTTPAQTALLSLDGSSEHDTATDTSSRRALLVRMGMVRARLDSGGKVRAEGGWLRPVAESLRREVEELAKSGTAGRSRSGSGGP